MHEISINEYLDKKKKLAILFTNDQNKQIEFANELKEKLSLKEFYSFLVDHIEKGYLDGYCKENVIYTLSLLRDTQDIETIEIINDLYRKINTQKDNSIEFYKKEMVKRFNIREESAHYYIEDNKTDIIEAILLDPIIIYAHLIMPNPIFNKFIPLLASNPQYTICISSLLFEIPSLEDDKEFLRRIKLVFEEKYKKLSRSKEKRKLKSAIRYFDKQIKEI